LLAALPEISEEKQLQNKLQLLVFIFIQLPSLHIMIF